MKRILITGCNRGLGLEFVRQYLDDGAQVIACCRSPEKAVKLQELSCSNLQILALDVGDTSSIAALQNTLQKQNTQLDLFINNAGVYGPRGEGFAGIDKAAWLEVFSINTIAPLQVTEAILPFMDPDGAKKLAYLSSKMGSIADNEGGGAYVYRSSKTALNQVLMSLSIDLKSQGFAVAALHPGWVQTDMGGPNALINAQTSVAGMRTVINALKCHNSGTFFNYDGQHIPW